MRACKPLPYGQLTTSLASHTLFRILREALGKGSGEPNLTGVNRKRCHRDVIDFVREIFNNFISATRGETTSTI